MKHLKGLMIFMAVMVFWSATVIGKNEEVASAEQRIDEIDKDHRRLIREHLQLTPEEARAFWPVYEAYTAEYERFVKLRLDYAKQLSDRFEHFDDSVGEQVVADMLVIDKTPGQVWEKFLPSFLKAVGGRKTARFYQVERRIRIFVDAELSREFPLIP